MNSNTRFSERAVENKTKRFLEIDTGKAIKKAKQMESNIF